MGWNIGIHKNTLRVTEETADALIEQCEDNNHFVYTKFEETRIDGINFYSIDFNTDEMEHMDFLNEDWAHNIIVADPANYGEVVFISVEGDNAGDIWGYKYLRCERTHLTGDIVIKETVY